MFARFRHLTLEKPLVVLDVETTGTDSLHDRFVKVAAVRCDPGGRTVRRRQLVNPGVPIPAPATAVHGIGDADVAAAPAFADVASRLLEFVDDADLVGFNLAKFDLPMFLAELDRCGQRLRLPAEPSSTPTSSS